MCTLQLANLSENGPLDLLALGCRFDDQLCIGHRRIVADRLDASQKRICFLTRNFLFRHLPLQRFADSRLACLGPRQIDVGQKDPKAGRGADLRYACAHLPCTDHCHCPHGYSPFHRNSQRP